MQRKNTAFTLVELIVVITILAILGTIAFISLSGYSTTSRDSVRLADSSSMRTSLEIYQINSGKYPLPDQNGYFTLDSETLWWQGKFNGTVIDNLSRNFSEAPQDPILEKTYTYSVAGNKNEYQLLVLLEGDENALSTINQTNAATKVRTPKVSGTYNGLYVKTASKFVALPSIITALDYNEGENVLDGSMMISLVVNGYDNVPNEGNIKYVTGTLDIPEVIYSTGTVTTTDGDGAKASVLRMLQNAYSGSNLSNDGIYKYITDLDENDDELLANVLDTVVLGNAADISITKTSTPLSGGSFIIDEGATTSILNINLSIICANNENTPIEMYISGDITNTSTWETCSGTGSKALTLTSGDGIKTINIKFKDNEGTESSQISNNISLTLCGNLAYELNTGNGICLDTISDPLVWRTIDWIASENTIDLGPLFNAQTDLMELRKMLFDLPKGYTWKSHEYKLSTDNCWGDTMCTYLDWDTLAIVSATSTWQFAGDLTSQSVCERDGIHAGVDSRFWSHEHTGNGITDRVGTAHDFWTGATQFDNMFTNSKIQLPSDNFDLDAPTSHPNPYFYGWRLSYANGMSLLSSSAASGEESFCFDTIDDLGTYSLAQLQK